MALGHNTSPSAWLVHEGEGEAGEGNIWPKVGGLLLLKGPRLGGAHCHGKAENPTWFGKLRRVSFSEMPHLVP